MKANKVYNEDTKRFEFRLYVDGALVGTFAKSWEVTRYCLDKYGVMPKFNRG